MGEIEKLYENAEVKLRKVCTNVDCDCDKVFCDECEYFKDNIFAFTAEKQIELIKKLGNINMDIDNGCYMSSEILEVEAHRDTFEETLAEFVNNLWRNLTEAEKQQIKEILERE